jgi:predicted nucleotidyltransferase
MSPEFLGNPESNETLVYGPPAVELLLDPQTAKEAWPESIGAHEEALRQIEQRKVLSERIEAILTRLPRPDISLEAAVREQHLEAKAVTDCYNALSDLFERETDYHRLALYLPFEFLPSSTWEASDPDLKAAAERFRNAYKSAWNHLLSSHDVRANFVDGDVLEIEQRTEDLPRVVKAAHLIPFLTRAGIVSVDEVITIFEASNDAVLKHSIADTLPVLADMGYLNAAHVERIRASNDPLLGNMAAFIELPNGSEPPQTLPSEITPQEIEATLEAALARIDREDYGDASERRVDWLRSEARQKALDGASDELAKFLMDAPLSSQSIRGFTASERPSVREAFVEGVRKAIESKANHDSAAAKELYGHYREALMALWENAPPFLRDALLKTFYHFSALNVMTKSELAELDITLPALAGPFSENIGPAHEEIEYMKNVVGAIEADPELASRLYPAVLIFGSRLKGYAQDRADSDIGVFIKPDASLEDHHAIQSALQKLLHDPNRSREAKEFWLEEKGGALAVRDLGITDASIADSSWTHALFGGVWEGNPLAMRELREKVLAPYFFDSRRILFGQDARKIYLQSMEQDALQYRLLHKGYARFFPSYGGIATAHAGEIDGKSTFWDSGYRQTATKLFINRVFLPRITEK